MNQPYRPATSKYTKLLAEKKNKMRSSSKWEFLHSDSSKKLLRSDKNKDDQEYEKNIYEYTF